MTATYKPNLIRSNRLPMLLQTEAAECGVACLAMIACYHGSETDLPAVRTRLSVSLKGMNLLQLIDGAQALGFGGRPLRLEVEEIRDLAVPCILHWDLNHFVVLKEVRGTQLIIHDPALGLRKVSIKEASLHFTGVALELSPTPDFEPRKDRIRISVMDLFGRIRGLKRNLFQIFAISIAFEICSLLTPLYVQWTVDHVLAAGDRDLLTLLAMGFALLVAAQVFIAGLRSWMILNLSTGIGIQWSLNVFSHLIRLPQSYFEKRHLGDVVSRFDSIGSIQKTLTSSFVEGIIDGIMALTTLGMMISYSGMLSTVVIISVTLYATLRISAYSPLRRATEEQIVLSSKQQSAFLESIRGIQAIKLFSREVHRQTLWHNRLVESTNRLLATQRFMVGYKLSYGILAGLENILVVWIGAQLILSNALSIGMLFAFVAFKNVFSGRMSSLVDKAIDLKMLGLQGERLADIVLTPKELNLTSANGMQRIFNGDIVVSNLSFRYSEVDPLILSNLSMDIPSGKSVAIIGPSGCGKTTLAKILLGLLTPSSGKIIVGGIDLKNIDISAFRKKVNAVMQDDQLFAGSIADNISFFAEKLDSDRAKHSATLACIHADIETMSMGYDTLIGDMGTALSGGQKQRILLARALYREPQILVLDEATSHLDVALEHSISAAVSSLKMTRIIIAHRPETISSCDIVIDLSVANEAER